MIFQTHSKPFVVIRVAFVSIAATALWSAGPEIDSAVESVCDPDGVSTASRLYNELIEGLQPPKGMLPASRSLCESTDPGSEWRGSAQDWYLERSSEEGCRWMFVPNLSTFMTGAHYGARHIPATSIDAFSELRFKVKALTKAVDSTLLPSLARFDVQQLAWEFYTGLSQYRVTEHDSLRSLADELARLIRASALSEREVEGLATDLKVLRTSNLPLDPTMLGRLLQEQTKVFEVVNRPQMHLGLTSGRLHGRVFLTATGEDGVKDLTRLLCSSSQARMLGFPGREQACTGNGPTDAALRTNRMFYSVPEVRAALLLYFNTLDRNLQIRPTPVLAAWREYSVTGVLSETASFLDAAERLRFGSAEYRRNLNWTCEMSPQYDWLPPEHPMAVGPLDTNAVAADETVLITTHRANCLQCHRHQVQSLVRMTSVEQLVFSPPFYFASESEYISGGLAPYQHQLDEWMPEP